MRLALIPLAMLAVAACSKQETTATLQPPYNATVDVMETMVHVMDPAARQFWAGWGEMADAEGVHDISPKTDEDWKKVEDGATTLIMATNTLMLPPYQRQPVDKWFGYNKQLADLAAKGRAGADAHDKQAMEIIGADIDKVCDSCHADFRKTTE